MEKLIKQRILDELFDDRVRYQPSEALREQYGSLKAVSTEKSKQGLAELYESEFKNFLGLGENKQDKLRTDILDSFKEVNYYLDSLSNFHFTPRPVAALKGEAVIVEERVPTSRWKGQT
jgi:U3 small nucleolar RNA-associated protein MPP10